MSLCLIAIYLTLGSLIFLGLSLYLWALPMVVPLVNPGGGTWLLLQNRSEAQERLFYSFILPTFASLWPQERGYPLPQLCDWDRARGAGLARFRPLRHREDVKAGARFRERRAALEGTGPTGGGERMELQTKTPGSLSQAASGTVPSPTRATEPTRSAGP